MEEEYKKNMEGMPKVEKEQIEEFGFDAGMESIGEPVDIVYSLAKIYTAVEN